MGKRGRPLGGKSSASLRAYWRKKKREERGKKNVEQLDPQPTTTDHLRLEAPILAN